MPAHNLTRAEAAKAVALVNRHHGNLTAAARSIRISRSTLQHRYERAKVILGEEIPQQQTIEIDPPKPRVRVRAAKPDGPMYRVLGIGDAHDAPDIPKDRFRWMGKHAVAMGADYTISIGDWLTLDSLNSHIPNESLLGKLKSPWSRDMQSAADAYGEFERGLGSHSCKKEETDGNHERRAWFYEDSHPEIEGVLTGELNHLRDSHGWAHHPYGEYFFLGGVGFIHCAINRLNKTYGGKNAEMTIGNDAVFDHVIGHSHVRREHRAVKLGPSKHVTILNLGCALPWGHVEEYMYHGALTGWWWGCHEIVIQGGQITDVNAISMIELEKRYG